ncbi:hypothetical protein AAVH_14357, partial [Aphelenchoides avenae]
MSSEAGIKAESDSGPAVRNARNHNAFDGDAGTRPSVHQDREHLERRIEHLEAEFQQKNASLEVHAKRGQVASDIISALREKIQTQGTNVVDYSGQHHIHSDSNVGSSVVQGSKRHLLKQPVKGICSGHYRRNSVSGLCGYKLNFVDSA